MTAAGGSEEGERRRPVRRALALWLVLVVVAVANGALREAWLAPSLGPRGGEVASAVLLSALILVVAYLSIRWIGTRTVRGAFAVGALWLVLTVAFEFLGGRYLFGVEWDELVDDYRFWRGRAWVLVLVTVFFAPWLAARARGLVGPPDGRGPDDPPRTRPGRPDG